MEDLQYVDIVPFDKYDLLKVSSKGFTIYDNFKSLGCNFEVVWKFLLGMQLK